MKKSFVIITSLILMCIILIGCNQPNNAMTTSRELNKNLNILSTTVKRLDTINNEYLANGDIYKLSQNQKLPTPNHGKNYIVTFSSNIVDEDLQNDIERINLKEDLTQALKNEIVNRIYCDNNGNCKLCKNTFECGDDYCCNNCNQTVICDQYGNCTSCGKQLTLNNNTCSSCNKNCVTTTPNTNISEATKNCLKRISNDNQELQAEKLSLYSNTNTDNRLYVNNSIDFVNNSSNTAKTQTNRIQEEANSTEENIETNNDNNMNGNIKFYYYSEDRFDPQILRYQPRHINSIDFDYANNSLKDYVDKVQKLYTMTADVIEANNTLANYKIIILDDINDAKELNNCILEGNCTPTNNQVLALNNYIADIKSTINNLKNCNGNLTNELNKISSTNTGISQSIEVTNSNYLRILNQIDARISFHENAIATLQQVKYLLQDVNNNNYSNLEVEDLIETKEDIIYDNNTTDSDTAPDIYITYDDVIDTIDNNSNIDSNTTIVSDDSINDNDNLSQTNNNLTYESLTDDNSSNTELANTNENETTLDNSYNNQDESTNTIPTDDQTTSADLANVDTYQDNYNNLQNTTTYENSDEDNNVALDNNANTNSTMDNEHGIYNDNAYLNTNPTNNTPFVNNYSNVNNTNNMPNSIISQNNINTDRANNLYRYDENGRLYNVTNGYNSNGIYNVNYDNNNVNTYEYNTLLDSINRGTIDNGINDL